MVFSDVQSIDYIAAVLFGIANAIATVLSPLLTGSIFPAKEISAAYGFVQSGTQFGMVAGSFVVAGISDLSGSYSLSWIVMAVFCVVCYICWQMALTNAKKYA